MNIVIQSDEELKSAIKRIQEITGAPEDTPEERELVELCLAVEIWRTKHRLG